MSDLTAELARLVQRLGDVRAALVIEASGIEVATWGEADFELAAAEWAELWRQLGQAEILSAVAGPRGVEIDAHGGRWIAVSLGPEYVLALLTGPDVPAGKARFYAREWVLEHREDFR